MPDLPSGTVTFLFTDIEGATALWERDRAAMRVAVARQMAILQSLIEAHHGVLYKTIGNDTQAAFSSAEDALRAAVAAQRALLQETWPDPPGSLRVRMALHVGEAKPDEQGDYLAASLNRLSRLLTLGHGGQILLTQAVQQLTRGALPAQATLRDLGEHRLRDLLEPEQVFQLLHPELPDEFPSPQSVEARTTNLPRQPTPFLGRETQVEEITALLRQPAVQLLTLTGAGGTGKTRLALQAAAELLDAFPAGVCFVPLSALTDPVQIPAAIATALGVQVEVGQSLPDRLAAFLASKHLLLVIDNWEHVLAGASLLSDLLRSAPGLTVLATSRAPLHLQAEREYPVPPLALPRRKPPPTLEQLSQYEAVRLFLVRAQAVKPDFAIDNENAPAVAEICHRLDGLPLAIELAAARLRLLPPQALLDRLEQRLPLLTGGALDLPERQRTLRATIAWSNDLLSVEEQLIFRRLAVFSGGFDLEAAEAVANPTGEVAVFEGVASLLDKSLLKSGALQDEPRYGMLETIREFGQEALAGSDELPTIRDAHAAYFAELATRAGPHLTGREGVGWLGRLETDHDNLRGALSWLVEQGDNERALALAASLWRFWWIRGYIDEGRKALEAALSVASNDLSPNRATALDGAGILAESQGDYARAEALHEEALSVSRQIGNTGAIARALNNLGVVAADRGDLQRAESLLRESLALACEANDSLSTATVLNDLGNVAYEQGQSEQAEAMLRESLTLRRLGNDSGIARSLTNLGIILLDRGEAAQARKLYQESLALFRAAGDKAGEAAALNGLAESDREEGNIPGAITLFEQSLAHFRDVGDLRSTAVVLLNLAEISRTCEAFEQAGAQYREALSGFAAVADRSGVLDSLAGLGGILVQETNYQVAAQLLGAASALSSAGDSVSPANPELFEADVKAVRAALGEGAFQAAWDVGRSLELADAVAMAGAVQSF